MMKEGLVLPCSDHIGGELVTAPPGQSNQDRRARRSVRRTVAPRRTRATSGGAPPGMRRPSRATTGCGGKVMRAIGTKGDVGGKPLARRRRRCRAAP